MNKEQLNNILKEISEEQLTAIISRYSDKQLIRLQKRAVKYSDQLTKKELILLGAIKALDHKLNNKAD